MNTSTFDQDDELKDLAEDGMPSKRAVVLLRLWLRRRRRHARSGFGFEKPSDEFVIGFWWIQSTAPGFGKACDEFVTGYRAIPPTVIVAAAWSSAAATAPQRGGWGDSLARGLHTTRQANREKSQVLTPGVGDFVVSQKLKTAKWEETKMQNDQENPIQPQSDEEMVQQFAQSTVETWSMTLVAYKRRIEALESRVAEQETAKILQQGLIDTLHARLVAVESLFGKGGTVQ
jgi:hypothetical protein